MKEAQRKCGTISVSAGLFIWFDLTTERQGDGAREREQKDPENHPIANFYRPETISLFRQIPQSLRR